MEQESQIQLAIAAFKAGEVSSIRKAAYLFDVPRSTLQHRLPGRRTLDPHHKVSTAILTSRRSSYCPLCVPNGRLGLANEYR